MDINKKRTKVYPCKFIELEYDDLGKYRWCHNDKAGCTECMCDNIFQMNSCPFFEKDDSRDKSGHIYEITDADRESVRTFLAWLDEKRKAQETKELALLAYLKRKYEV